ncbi:MAG: hypothetical protein M3004_11750, partial [Bacteroidota bacterium]|nr:hypothetical protein [Bacteroidota bacterium]
GIIGGEGNMIKNGKTSQIDISGDQKGNFVVTLSNGYLQSASYKINYKSDMEIRGQKIPMKMEMNYSLTAK